MSIENNNIGIEVDNIEYRRNNSKGRDRQEPQDTSGIADEIFGKDRDGSTEHNQRGGGTDSNVFEDSTIQAKKTTTEKDSLQTELGKKYLTEGVGELTEELQPSTTSTLQEKVVVHNNEPGVQHMGTEDALPPEALDLLEQQPAVNEKVEDKKNNTDKQAKEPSESVLKNTASVLRGDQTTIEASKARSVEEIASDIRSLGKSDNDQADKLLEEAINAGYLIRSKDGRPAYFEGDGEDIIYANSDRILGKTRAKKNVDLSSGEDDSAKEIVNPGYTKSVASERTRIPVGILKQQKLAEAAAGHEERWQDTKVELGRQTEQYQQSEDESLSPNEVENMALEQISNTKLGKELEKYIKEQEKVQPPVKLGFFRRLKMKLFDRKGLELYKDRKKDYKEAQKKLIKAKNSKETWLAKETILIVETEKVNSELKKYSKKIENSEMTKRDWKYVEKITSKNAILRDGIDRQLLGDIVEDNDLKLKAGIPKRNNWEGVKESKDFNKKVEEIKLSIIEGMKGQLGDAESYTEEDLNRFGAFQKFIGSNPEMKRRLADLSPEWQETFFKEQAGESFHQIAEAIATQELLLEDVKSKDSLKKLIKNPQTAFQKMASVRTNSTDIDRGWNSIERSLDRYSKAESLQSLGRGIKTFIKREFAERIVGVSPNFETEFDTAVTDILKNGTSRVATVARGAREAGGAFQKMGNRTKYGLKIVQEKTVSFVDRHLTLEGKYARKITELNNELAELNEKRDEINEIINNVINSGLNAKAEINLNDEERQEQINEAIKEQQDNKENRQRSIEEAIREQIMRRIREEAEKENERRDAIVESTEEARRILREINNAEKEREIIDSAVKEIIISISLSIERRNELLNIYASEGGLTGDFVDKLSTEGQSTKLRIERARSEIQKNISEMEADLKLEKEKLAKSLNIAAEEVSGDYEHELESVIEDLRKIDLASEEQIDQIYEQMEEEIEKLRSVFEKRIFEDLQKDLMT